MPGFQGLSQITSFPCSDQILYGSLFTQSKTRNGHNGTRAKYDRDSDVSLTSSPAPASPPLAQAHWPSHWDSCFAQSASGPLHDSLPSLCLELTYPDIPVSMPSFTVLSAQSHLIREACPDPCSKSAPGPGLFFFRALITTCARRNLSLLPCSSVSLSVSRTLSTSVSLCLSTWNSSYVDKYLRGFKRYLQFCDLVSLCSTLFHLVLVSLIEVRSVILNHGQLHPLTRLTGDSFDSLSWKGRGCSMASSGPRPGLSAPSLLPSQHLGGSQGCSGCPVGTWEDAGVAAGAQ